MRYFNESEFKKDPAKVQQELKTAMDNLRHLAGDPIFVHVAWDDSGHSKNSYHYKGMACDFHFLSTLTPIEQYAMIRSIPGLRGIGWYPWWHRPGWHVDLREDELFWVSPGAGEYIYDVQRLIDFLV